MHLVTQKIVPPSSFPSLPSFRAEKYVYRLGISLCPSMDLVATYPILTPINLNASGVFSRQDLESDDDAAGNDYTQTQGYAEDDDSVNVEVWRFNGQRVFGIAIESEHGGKINVQSVSWRSDGQMIAVLSTDQSLRLVSSFSGKVVHRFSSLPTYRAPPSPKSPRTTRNSGRSATSLYNPKARIVSYSTHFSNAESTRKLLRSATVERFVVLDDLLSLNADIKSLLKSPADLPHELANIDIEAYLPRLSCLPPIGFGGEDVFSTRTSIDTIFHSSKKNVQSGTVDVLLAGHNDGMISVRIFDSFEIGGIDLNSAASMRKATHVGSVFKVASWPFTNEIFVIAGDTKSSDLHLFALDLKFITAASNTLPILATKATQLQNLLRYLTQVQNQLAREVKTAFDLPTRFLRNINEDLENQDGAGACFATAAYHAIVTGEVSGAFKDWLNEQLGERGVKRWEKSVGDCLELVRRLVSEAWCPAVERAGVVVSRLNGLASWHAKDNGEGPRLGLDRKLVDGLRDTLDVMTVCGEECLKEVVNEINGFASFIRWLKWEVEASALEDTSERLEEMRESSDHGDIAKVVDYIEQGPQESVVKNYLDASPQSALVSEDQDTDFYIKFKEQRKKVGRSGNPTFDQLLKRMHKQCDHLFEQIAQSLRQSIMTRYITPLGAEADESVMDMCVIPLRSVNEEAENIQVNILSRKRGDRTSIVQQTVQASGNQAKTDSIATRHLAPPGSDGVLDVRFADNESFMVLAETINGVSLYSHHIAASQDDAWELRHVFEEGIMESGMKPATMQVNGRKKRRVVGVGDVDGKGYVVYDLDSGDAEQSVAGEDETMTG